jgi:hypothetical protein
MPHTTKSMIQKTSIFCMGQSGSRHPGFLRISDGSSDRVFCMGVVACHRDRRSYVAALSLPGYLISQRRDEAATASRDLAERDEPACQRPSRTWRGRRCIDICRVGAAPSRRAGRLRSLALRFEPLSSRLLPFRGRVPVGIPPRCKPLRYEEVLARRYLCWSSVEHPCAGTFL